MNLLFLFLNFTFIGIFSIGGGRATLALIQDYATERTHLLTLDQFSSCVGISLFLPGPVLITSTAVGYFSFGLWGAIIATVGVFWVPCLTSAYFSTVLKKVKNSILFKNFQKSAKIIILASLTNYLFTFTNSHLKPNEYNWEQISITCFSLLLFWAFRKINPGFIILACMLISVFLFIFS